MVGGRAFLACRAVPEAASSWAPEQPAAAGLDVATELQLPAPTQVPRYPDLGKPSASWVIQRVGFHLYASMGQAFQPTGGIWVETPEKQQC